MALILEEGWTLMIRANRGDSAYWKGWVTYGEESICQAKMHASTSPGDPSYEPQYLFTLMQKHLHQMLRLYSAGNAVAQMTAYFPGLLDAWDRSKRLGAEQWNEDEQYTRNAWRVNYDHYIVCFWLVGLALALEIPDQQWEQLLTLVGNEGEDHLLDRIIASRSPQRRIGDVLLYPKPYARLLKAIDDQPDQRASALLDFVQHWYGEVGAGARSGVGKQATAFKHPYWYRYGDENFEGGAYFGRWCVEAVAAVKAFGLDDRLCLGQEHYPQALLHPETLPAQQSLEAQPEERRGFWSRLFNRKSG